MAIRFTNPLRAVWGYMRGDDLRAAEARALARATAARATPSVGLAPAPEDGVGASTRAAADRPPTAR